MSEESVTALTERLGSPDREARLKAAQALGTFQAQEALGPLSQAIKDEDPGVRREAALALGSLKDNKALAPLIKVLKDPDPSVREAVTMALQKLAGEGEEATSTQDTLREWAAWSLGDREDRARTITPREPTGQDKQVFGGWAGWALGELGEPVDAQAARQEMEEWNEEADEATMEAQTGRAIDRLIADLESSEDWVRLSAASTLETWRDPRVQEALGKAAQGPDETVKDMARSILQKREEAKQVSGSPQVRILVQGVSGLIAGENGAIQVLVQNKGEARAFNLEVYADGSGREERFRLDALEPGQGRVVEVKVTPQEHGSQVLFSIVAAYRDPGGAYQEMMAQTFLPVAPPRQTHEGTPSPGADPFRVCPYCGKALDLPKTPRFCPYCAERLLS